MSLDKKTPKRRVVDEKRQPTRDALSRFCSLQPWILEPLLRFRQRADGRGRPPRDTRAVLNGVLWILRTGARWRELPKKYPPYQTCPSALSAMGAQRTTGESAAHAGPGTAPSRFVAAGGGLAGRQFRERKKGAWLWGPPSAARERKSWPSPLTPAFLWRSPSIVPRPTKHNSSTKP